MSHLLDTTAATHRKVFTLLQLNTALKQAIRAATQERSFWIKAEIASISIRSHAYLELVQHEQGDRVAVMRGMIWRSDLETIGQALGGGQNGILKEGSEILFKACVHFHEVFGLSLRIEEVDLSFSLGELERRKQETIETLKREGIFELNRSLPAPMIMQRLAVITSAGTAAYADLMQHLQENQYGYRFHVVLFQSLVQGAGAAAALCSALRGVDHRKYDAVVIARGGGSRLDLEPFNDLELCRTIARMPIPVLTGIGHETDVSVADLVAHGHHRTPTAIADALVERCLYFETNLNGFLVSIHRSVSRLAYEQKERLGSWSQIMRMRPVHHLRSHRSALQVRAGQCERCVLDLVADRRDRLVAAAQEMTMVPLHRVRDVQRMKLQHISRSISAMARNGMRALYQRITAMDEAVAMMAPERTLSRGFSITRMDGKVITHAANVTPGDQVVTEFAQGRIHSTVNRVEIDGEGETDV